MAGRFAAKEAFVKALRAPAGMSWQDIEVVTDQAGAPSFALHGAAEARAKELGITSDAPVDLARHHRGDGLRGGRVLTAHTVADIRAAEEALMATLPEGELMQRAARGLADALDVIPAGELVVALIGPGNNGGDALYAATHLLDRGVRVDLCLLDDEKVHRDGSGRRASLPVPRSWRRLPSSAGASTPCWASAPGPG